MNDVTVRFNVERHPETALWHVVGHIYAWPLDDEDADEMVMVGTSNGYWMPSWSCLDDEDVDRLCYDLDNISGEALHHGELTRKITETDLLSQSVFASWLCVCWMTLDQKYRGNDLSFHAMKEWIECFGSGALIVALPNQSPPDGATRDKTMKHWVRFGFTEVAYGLMIDNTLMPGNQSWLGASQLGLLDSPALNKEPI